LEHRPDGVVSLPSQLQGPVIGDGKQNLQDFLLTAMRDRYTISERSLKRKF
jgi:hypothetical protein